MGTRISLQNVRLSHPHLFQARAVQAGDDPKFGAAFLIPKNNPAVPAILSAIEAEKTAQWGANAPPSAGSTLYDGDTDPKYNIKPENHGHYILNSSSAAEQPPILVDMNGQKVINPATFYPGCYVNADVGFYGYDKGVSKGIAAGLNGVQFVQDGERLDNRPTAEQMFGAPAGAPPAIAPGVGQQPVGGPAAQPAANPYAPAAPPVGAPAAPPPVAPQQPAAPATGGYAPPPSFLG